MLMCSQWKDPKQRYQIVVSSNCSGISSPDLGCYFRQYVQPQAASLNPERKFRQFQTPIASCPDVPSRGKAIAKLPSGHTSPNAGILHGRKGPFSRSDKLLNIIRRNAGGEKLRPQIWAAQPATPTPQTGDMTHCQTVRILRRLKEVKNRRRTTQAVVFLYHRLQYSRQKLT